VCRTEFQLIDLTSPDDLPQGESWKKAAVELSEASVSLAQVPYRLPPIMALDNVDDEILHDNSCRIYGPYVLPVHHRACLSSLIGGPRE